MFYKHLLYQIESGGSKMSKKNTQHHKKKNKLVFVASLWQIFIIPTFYMHEDDLWGIDCCNLPRKQQ